MNGRDLDGQRGVVVDAPVWAAADSAAVALRDPPEQSLGIGLHVGRESASCDV